MALATLALAASTSALACGHRGSADAAGNDQPAVVEVGHENVVTVARGEIVVGPLISGDLRAEREATVRAELGGQVTSVGPDEGQPVSAGTVLARIEARTQEDAFQSAQSQLRSAEEALGVAERELARTERLVKGGALAERDLETARNALVAARAQRDDAQSRLAAARKALGDATVRAPFAGIVASRHVSAGDVVSTGAELYSIIDPSSMRLQASVPSDQLGAIEVGLRVSFEVRGYPEQTFEGRIQRISPVADPVTRQVPIFVAIPNTSGRLVAGLFAQGRVLHQVSNGLVVPTDAVDRRSGQPFVVRVRNGKAERVAVTVGLHDEQSERVEIASGVQEGDVLLVGAAQGMTPGTPVRVRDQAAAAGE
jgi:RND family efflux transporter MFP subunit